MAKTFSQAVEDIKKEAYSDFYRRQGILFSVDPNQSDKSVTIHARFDKNSLAAKRKRVDFFDGLAGAYYHKDKSFEVYEYQAGPRKNELRIYAEPTSIQGLLRDMAKGNKRKKWLKSY